MSRENVERVKRIQSVWNAQGSPVPSGLLAPEVEWVNPPEAVEPGIRRGIEAFDSAARRVGDIFRAVRMEIEEYREAGDRVVVLATLHGEGRGSGASVERKQGYVWTLRDGKAIRFEWFSSHAEALAVVGLEE